MQYISIAILAIGASSFAYAQAPVDISPIIQQNQNYIQLNNILMAQNPQLMQSVQSICGDSNKSPTPAQNDACNNMFTQALAISNDSSLSQQDKLTKLQAVYETVAQNAGGSGANSSNGKTNSASPNLHGFETATLIALAILAIAL